MAKRVDINPALFLDRTSLIFGAADSGKTVMTKHILREIGPYLVALFVINPTNRQKHDYDGITPGAVIFDDIDEQWFFEIWERQKQASSMYDLANDKMVIEDLFKKVAAERDTTKLREFDAAFAKVKRRANDNEVQTLVDSHEKKMLQFMKRAIGKHKDRLLASPDTTEKERYTLTYLNFNPRIGILIEDATATAEKYLSGHKSEIFSEMFYRCRHMYVTIMISLHDDKVIDSSFKKNAFNTVFTTKQVATAYFERPSNHFSAYEKQESRRAIADIFSTSTAHLFNKFYYNRSGNIFASIRAEKKAENEPIGDPLFWELCEACTTQESDRPVIQGEGLYANLFKLKN